ncbi:hypothetical protein BP6252_01905 [Coleophoma cylindrospora]|uniref:Uncharacterized protein n=1 Tax=Coleophoma cylindrospora TaxID=1849047 RepID=A0A3D8SD86_9HELO|nr:hypothetical protein BP6252_01905 [Coleophoma cylindrospora]
MATVPFLCNDDSFGPSVGGTCRGGFDFSVVFEESIFSIGPAALLLLTIPLRVFQLHRRRRKVKNTTLHVAKLSVIATFAALQVALIVIISQSPPVSRVSIASASLDLAAALGIGLLSHLEHSRSIHPSFLLTIYLLTTFILDLARVRTQWLIRNNSAIAAILTVSTLQKLVLLVLEDLSKRNYLIRALSSRSLAFEATSGLFSRTLFFWLLPLLLVGYKGILRASDLFLGLSRLESRRVSERLSKSWVQCKKDSQDKATKKTVLVRTVVRAFGWEYIGVVFPRLCVVGLKLAQPFLVQSAVRFVDSSTVERENGYGLIGAYALVYTGIAIFTGWYQHITYRLVVMIRGGLVAMIYDKMLYVKSSTTGDSAAVTLMGTDVERIAEVLPQVGDVWADCLQVAIAIYLLERQLGVVCVIPVVVAIVACTSSFGVGKFVTARQRIWLEAIEKRIHTTSQILGEIKSVKMMGLSEKMTSIIQGMRIAELKHSVHYRKLSVTNTCLVNVPMIITPVLTFAAFVTTGNGHDTSFNVNKAFTSLSILTLLGSPTASIVFAIPSLYSVVGCFQRIQKFLLQESRDDVVQDTNRDSLTGLQHSAEDGTELRTLIRGSQYIPDELFQDTVMITNGSFGWSTSSAPVIQSIDIRIPKAAITIITGPSGSGKSTLLKGILNETPTSSGSVYVEPVSKAFCDQTPWIVSGSIRENILGTLDLEEPWYNVVVRACALERDFANLPAGDYTEVGSKGVMLSGGQKQRVAIARAVYARKRLAIFDDVLSGLDTATAESVFASVFGSQGLLREIGATVIFVTHDLRLLRYANNIIQLTDDGRVAKQGSFEDLRQFFHWKENVGYQNQTNSTTFTAPCTIEEDVPQPTQPRESSENARQRGDLSIYKYYISAMGLGSLSIYASIIACEATATGMQYIWLNWWTSAATQNNASTSVNTWIGVYALFALLESAGIALACVYLFMWIVPKSAKNLHWQLLQAVINAPMSVLTKIETGFLVNRFSQDMRLIDMTLPAALANSSFQFASCVTGAILTTIAVKYVAVLLPVLCGALYLVQKFYLRTSRQLRLLEIETKAPLHSHFIETQAGITTIRAFSRNAKASQQNIDLLDASQRPFYLLLSVQRWLTLVLDLIVAGLAIFLITLATTLRSSISAGLLGIALVNVMSLGETLSNLVQFWTSLETSLGAIARVKEFVEETPVDVDGDSDVVASSHESFPEGVAVTFEEFSAAYDQHGTNVLSNINLVIAKGEKVAICGRSGSGKSTLLTTLLRLLPHTSGNISLGNTSLSSIPQGQLRRKVITLPQEPFLFPGTVRLNIDPFGIAATDQIINTLKKVKLWDGNLASKEGGLDAELKAEDLSHGQRQLFCLARALLRKSEGWMLVLDEPTSSVDSQTDALMQRLIREDFADFTIIMIAHRLESILDFDKVAVLEKGRLVEFDNPTMLKTREGSAFRALIEKGMGV